MKFRHIGALLISLASLAVAQAASAACFTQPTYGTLTGKDASSTTQTLEVFSGTNLVPITLLQGLLTGGGISAIELDANCYANYDLQSVAGTTALTGAGATGAGSLRTTTAQDTTTIAGSAPGTAGSPSANVVTTQGVTGGTPIATVNTVVPIGGTAINGSASTTGNTAVTLLAAAGAGVVNYAAALECWNSSGTNITISFNDTASTQIFVPQTYGNNVILPPGLTLQTAANTALTFTASGSVTSCGCAVQGWKK